MRHLVALTLLAAVAACVPPPPPAREPPPRPQPAPPPLPPHPPRPPWPPSDWRDWAPNGGSWTYGRDARGSRAMFGAAGRDAALVLRCDLAERRVFLSRAGTASLPLTIRTTSITRELPVRPTGGTPPYAAAALATNDPLLDAMAFSRGKFVVDQPGAQLLVLPAWAEIGRVVEDCRG